MDVALTEWLNLAIRWLHLTAGIAWIGSSFYFVWLDNHLKPPREGSASGEVWSVHGGGFYHNQKYQVAPAQMPDELHWFKWEAYFTWISGFSLLVLIYYVGASSFLIDPAKAALSPAQGIAIGLASLVIGWIVYDLLCRSTLGESNQALGIAWFICLLFAAYALDTIFTARAAYLHVGAIIGSAMVGNVFFVIIPNQRKVVADLIAGHTPDPALGKAAKQRSLHNNYMTLPVLFIMISHHYPMTYGADRPWLVLALLGVTGVAVRHVFNLRHRAMPTGRAIALATLIALVSVTYVTFEKGSRTFAGKIPYAQVAPILQKHCVDCHAAHPTHPEFPSPPLGVMLDSYDRAQAAAPRIKAVTVDSEVMPLGNITGMTKEERDAIGAWIAAGAPE
jgi:uncharacterized membrane protein